GHDQRESFEKNARSMPTTMPAAATRPTRSHTTHLGDQWTRCGTGCALVDTIRLVQCEAGVRCGPWTRGQAPPEPATTSASTAITSETGPYSHHSGSPLLQVKAASVSTRKAAASAQAKNRITRSGTKVCCHNPTRARTINTAAMSST